MKDILKKLSDIDSKQILTEGETDMNLGISQGGDKECPICYGYGEQTDGEPCDHCGGSGTVLPTPHPSVKENSQPNGTEGFYVRETHNGEFVDGPYRYKEDIPAEYRNKDGSEYEILWLTAEESSEDMMQEEQVNELSPNTLKSYVKKAVDPTSEKSISNLASAGGYKHSASSASKDVHDTDTGEADDRKAFMRSKGVDRAVNKLTKEEQVTEGQNETYGDLAAWKAAAKAAGLGIFSKVDKSEGYVAKDSDGEICGRFKMEGGGPEQSGWLHSSVFATEDKVTEVSKKTLGNYIDKAADDLKSQSWTAGSEGNSEFGSWKAEREASKIADKRLKGIQTAAKKLSTTESLTEESNRIVFVNDDGEEAYITPKGSKWLVRIPDMDIEEVMSSLMRAGEFIEDYGYSCVDSSLEEGDAESKKIDYRTDAEQKEFDQLSNLPTEKRTPEVISRLKQLWNKPRNEDEMSQLKETNTTFRPSKSKKDGLWYIVDDNNQKLRGYEGYADKESAQAECDALYDPEALTEKSKSAKQARFMAACAHGADYKSCPPTSVAKEFNKADQKAGTLKNESENDDLAGDDFVNDETYSRLKKHIAAKHPGFKVHGVGADQDGAIHWQAFHINDKNFTKPIHGVFNESALEEGRKEKTLFDNELAWKKAAKKLGATTKLLHTGSLVGNTPPAWFAYDKNKEQIGRFGGAKKSGWLYKTLQKTTESKGPNMKKTIKESTDFLAGTNVSPGLEKILRQFGKETKDFIAGGDLADELYNVLYDYYWDEMPYGTKKARTGDPFEWVAERLEKELALDDENLEIDINKHGIDQDNYDHLDLPKTEGAAGDIMALENEEGTHACVYCGKDVPPGAEPTMHQCCGEVGHNEPVTDLDEAGVDIAAVKARAAQRAADAAAIARGENPGYKPNPFKPTAPTSVNPRADLRAGEKEFGMGESLDEAFLVEENEELITEVLQDMGLDHGLDFFFDEGLVAIGKSTARVIINALKADPRIKGTPSFGRIDGEEVQITFNKQARPTGPDLKVSDIPAADFNIDEAILQPTQDETMEESKININNLAMTTKASLKAEIKKLTDKMDSIVKDGGKIAQNDPLLVRQRSMKKKLATMNEEVSMSISANGEDDVVNIIRKLSGLGNSTEEESHSEGSSIADMMSMFSNEPEVEVEVEMDEADTEGEYVNAPEPTVHTSTTDMINQGNDLNRPKKQDYTVRNLGDNPMSEARNLMQQYEEMMAGIKK